MHNPFIVSWTAVALLACGGAMAQVAKPVDKSAKISNRVQLHQDSDACARQR